MIGIVNFNKEDIMKSESEFYDLMKGGYLLIVILMIAGVAITPLLGIIIASVCFSIMTGALGFHILKIHKHNKEVQNDKN